MKATCTETGLSEGKHCSECNKVLVAQTVINALGHNMSTSWIYNDVNHFHKCNNCDYSVDISSHTYSTTYNDSNNSTLQSSYECKIQCTICQYEKIVNAVAATMKSTGYRYYTSIEAALGDAVSDDTVYVLPHSNANPIVISNNCTISSGVTLSLPYEISDGSIKIEEKTNQNYTLVYGNNDFLKNHVIIAEGVTVTNRGTIFIGGKANGGNGGGAYAGQTCDMHSQITLEKNAQIINFGKITSFGFIVAEKENTALINKSGSTLEIPFVVREHRGGTIFKNWYENLESNMDTSDNPGKPESAFNRFYMPNIVGLSTYEYGSTLIGKAMLYANEDNYQTDVKIIGTSTENLLSIGENTVIETVYDSIYEKHNFNVYGDLKLGSMKLSLTLKLGGFIPIYVNLDTSSVLFPISHYYNINLYKHKAEYGGHDATVSCEDQDIKLLPGASLTINEGVTVNVTNLAIYDEYLDEHYASLGAKNSRYPQNLDEAKLVIDGTLNVANIGGYIVSNHSSGVLNISDNTYIVCKHMISSGKEYESVTKPLILDLYTNNSINYRKDNITAGKYYSTVYNGDICWAEENTLVEIVYDLSNYDNQNNIVNNNPNSIKVSQTIDLNEPTIDPADSSITFVGWYNNPDFSGEKITKISGYDYVSCLTLYGKWTREETYTVTWKNEDKSVLEEDKKLILGSTSTYNGSTPKKVSTAQYNYEFIGWIDNNGNSYSIGYIATVAGNVTFTAQYKTIDREYTITFNTNGGSAIEPITQVWGTPVTKPTNPTKPGYTFGGWYSDEDLTIPAEVPTKMPADNITITAKWKPINYKIRFDANGGQGTMADQDYTYASGDPLDDNTFVAPDGKKFGSWNTKKDGKEGTAYNNKAVFKEVPNYADEIIIVYAQWVDDGIGCFTTGTQILMADGSYRNIENVKVGDNILTWNMFTGKYEAAPVLLHWYHEMEEHNVINLEFSDEYVLRIAIDHGLFNVEKNMFIYINEFNYKQFIGDKFIAYDNGTYKEVTLLNAYVTVENTMLYSLKSAFNDNAIANNMFTLTPEPVDGIFRYFTVGENLTYDQELMERDINKFGLSSYEDWKEYISEEVFYALNGQYFNILIGKEIISKEQIIETINNFVYKERIE